MAEFYRLLEEGKKAARLPKAGEIDTVNVRPRGEPASVWKC